MKVCIMTDMEGLGGVNRPNPVHRGDPEYPAARERLMCEVNAAVAGILRDGPHEVYVFDGHGGGGHFIEGKLHPKAVQFHDIDDIPRLGFDAGMSIGTHAMAGTQNAFFEHTQDESTVYNFFINGVKCGETEQFAGYLGVTGAPVVMVSGDAAACEQARERLGDIAVAIVKTAVTRNEAASLPDAAIHEAIASAAHAGMKRIPNIKPLTFTLPMEQVQAYTHVAVCDDRMNDPRRDPHLQRVDSRTVRRTVPAITCYADLVL